MNENYEFDDLDLDSLENQLNTVDGVTLADMDLPPIKYAIKDLLPQGLAMLSGSMKIGKSWMTLDWCVRIAKGENIWNFPTTKGTTLYLSLEDSNTRLQDRLLSVTDDVPPNVHFAISCKTIGNGLEEQIRSFVGEHPNTVLVAIDIFQKIRTTTEINYGGDYFETEILRMLANELGITILLVHHVRKKEDEDPFNMMSGSNGLAGCADTIFVLKKSKRCSSYATLFCTGRDTEYREIDVHFVKETCTWDFVSDSADTPEMLLPKELKKLVEMMKEISAFSGSNADFMEQFKSYSGFEIHTNVFKKMMHRWESELAENGVTFEDSKRNNERCIDISYDTASTADTANPRGGFYCLYCPCRPQQDFSGTGSVRRELRQAERPAVRRTHKSGQKPAPTLAIHTEVQL